MSSTRVPFLSPCGARIHFVNGSSIPAEEALRLLRSVASHAHCFVQVIAWSGAGLDTYALPQPNGTTTLVTGLPDELPENVKPAVPILFRRQVAGDNTSIALNTSFIPQVSPLSHTKLFVLCQILVRLSKVVS